jgi:uncharacterized OB-fold protein
MEGVKLKGEGKIVSYTIIHEGAESFKAQMPYVLAIIELDEGPCVTGQIVGISVGAVNDSSDSDTSSETSGTENEQNEELAIGSRVTSVFRKISEDGKSGIIHYGYKFKMAEK